MHQEGRKSGLDFPANSFRKIDIVRSIGKGLLSRIALPPLRVYRAMLGCSHMQTLVIDTNGIAKKLEQRGFSRSQAEGITEALKELDVSTLATKADIRDGLREFEVRFYKFLAGVLVAHGLGTAALTVTLIELLA